MDTERENIQGLNTKLFRANGDDRVWLGLRLKTKSEREHKPSEPIEKPNVAPVIKLVTLISPR